ncbi:MAG: c-type cytochrome [Nitrospirae bacterium]|nr:c-type cytochrome [Nitrospirota bacterium]
MENNGYRNLFIFGSLACFAILIALTVNTFGKLDQRAEPITEEVNAGKMVWHKYDCIGCHTILGNGSYFAPDMTKIASRIPKSYLKKFLMDPKKTNAHATMPKLGITAEEADQLIVFLDWISKVDTNGWPPKPIMTVTAGNVADAYTKYQCADCHSISGVGGTSGPDLSHEASIHPDADWQLRHLTDPASVVADSAMTPFPDMSQEERTQIVNFLLTLK